MLCCWGGGCELTPMPLMPAQDMEALGWHVADLQEMLDAAKGAEKEAAEQWAKRVADKDDMIEMFGKRIEELLETARSAQEESERAAKAHETMLEEALEEAKRWSEKHVQAVEAAKACAEMASAAADECKVHRAESEEAKKEAGRERESARAAGEGRERVEERYALLKQETVMLRQSLAGLKNEKDACVAKTAEQMGQEIKAVVKAKEEAEELVRS